jgi:hypothetical protein
MDNKCIYLAISKCVQLKKVKAKEMASMRPQMWVNQRKVPREKICGDTEWNCNKMILVFDKAKKGN